MLRLAALPLLPNSSLPKQNWANRETPKIKVNLTEVSDHMGHRVNFMHFLLKEPNPIWRGRIRVVPQFGTHLDLHPLHPRHAINVLVVFRASQPPRA